MKRLKPFLLTLAAVGILSNAMASAETRCFHVGDHKDVVKFASDAPVELIEGTTSKIEGKVCYDSAFTFKNPENSFRGRSGQHRYRDSLAESAHAR